MMRLALGTLIIEGRGETSLHRPGTLGGAWPGEAPSIFGSGKLRRSTYVLPRLPWRAPYGFRARGGTVDIKLPARGELTCLGPFAREVPISRRKLISSYHSVLKLMARRKWNIKSSPRRRPDFSQLNAATPCSDSLNHSASLLDLSLLDLNCMSEAIPTAVSPAAADSESHVVRQKRQSPSTTSFVRETAQSSDEMPSPRDCCDI